MQVNKLTRESVGARFIAPSYLLESRPDTRGVMNLAPTGQAIASLGSHYSPGYFVHIDYRAP